MDTGADTSVLGKGSSMNPRNRGTVFQVHDVVTALLTAVMIWVGSSILELKDEMSITRQAQAVAKAEYNALNDKVDWIMDTLKDMQREAP